MPEGDTILRTADTLRRWIGGRQVTAARCTSPGVDPRRLIGATVEEVEARAKHLLIRVTGGLALHTHMGMTGSWHVYPTGERWRKPAHQARLVLEAGAHLAVCFNAPVVELLTSDQERAHGSLRRLGPDVLRPDTLDPVAVRARAQARAGASPTAGELLLDQQVVSGIGNIYRCESLFLCGVDPWTPSEGLDEERLDGLVATASRLMAANAGISAFSRSFDGGPDRPWVYRRAGRPCRRCATTVERGILGAQARPVYWCPQCQT
jgi:endonuclease VIII